MNEWKWQDGYKKERKKERVDDRKNGSVDVQIDLQKKKYYCRKKMKKEFAMVNQIH